MTLLQFPVEFEDPVRQVIEEMVASGRYRAILWAGGYPDDRRHSHSDIDLYAVASEPLPSHWVMERVGGRRIELTAYVIEEWERLLDKPDKHPKHRYTFAYGRVLFDPETLIPALTAQSTRVLEQWAPASPAEIAEMRNGVAIQQDKMYGFREKNKPQHLRLHAVGFVVLAVLLLCKHWDGYAVDAGKNLTRVLAHPQCPPNVRELIAQILTAPETDTMADAAIQLADRCLELTGGPINSYCGGIPR